MPRQKQKNYGQLVRINLNVSKEMKEWYQKEAEKRGLYMTSLIINAMHEYKKQEEAFNKFEKLEEMKDLFDDLKGMQKNILGKGGSDD